MFKIVFAEVAESAPLAEIFESFLSDIANRKNFQKFQNNAEFSGSLGRDTGNFGTGS